MPISTAANEKIPVNASVRRPTRPRCRKSPNSTMASDSAEKTSGMTTIIISRKNILPAG